MIKLTAAAAALSNSRGGGETVRDVRNGSQVMLNNSTFAHLSSLSTNNLRECKSQANNNKSGATTPTKEEEEEGALLTERCGDSNTCDNSFSKNGQQQTSWPQSLLQQQQTQTSPSTPSQLPASDLVKTSSIENDCSSIWGASVSAATTTSLPTHNQCNTQPVQQQQQQQRNSMPLQSNNQPKAPPMHIRSGAIKHCHDDAVESNTDVTKTDIGCCSIGATIDDDDDDDDNGISIERATSIGGGKPLVSDAGEFSC